MISSQTEKIVRLAREILVYERDVNADEQTEDMGRRINRYETIELDALIFYAAHLFKQEEKSLRQSLQNECGLATLRDLSLYDCFRLRESLYERLLGG